MQTRALLVVAVLGAGVLFLASGASARDQIRIVGASTVYPFATVVAEEFGRATEFKTPIIESTGTGGGLRLFCAGVGVEHPDITNASRRIKASEVELCRKGGVTSITEVKIGYDGIVLANSKQAARQVVGLRQIFLALAKQVPMPNGDLVANPDAFGVFCYSFLDQNADRIQGSTVDAVEPSFDKIASDEYPVSRSLYFYVKNAHMDPMLQGLRETLLRMGSRAEAILDKALRSVAEPNAQLAREVHDDDVEIDRLDVEIDDKVLKLLALQAPVAGDLREVVAVKMIGSDLERVGDLSRNIAQSSSRLALQPGLRLEPELVALARETQRLLRKALDSFSAGDADQAREVLEEDDHIDREEERLISLVLEEIQARPESSAQAVETILIAKNLERVADHATNIAEDVILIAEARNVKHAVKLGC
jgi:phosphate transport system regulatory protein PhoU